MLIICDFYFMSIFFECLSIILLLNYIGDFLFLSIDMIFMSIYDF